MLDYGDMKYKESLREIDDTLFELCNLIQLESQNMVWN